MLPPEYFLNCEDELIELYARFQERVVRDVSRRIVKTGRVTDSAYNQVEVLQQSGMLYDDVIKNLSDISGKSTETVREIFNDAAVESIGNDNVHIGLKKSDINLSPAMLQQIEAGIVKTDGLINNLTKTTAISSQTAYINACTLAEMEVSSGAFSYTEAIRHAIDDAADECAIVHYPSGAKATIDVAIRRAVMTGITQTAAAISLMNCDTIGTDLVEVSAHGGARPSHAEWQGKIFCIRGSRGRYRDFYKETGYGTGDGLCGWNCRHSFWPFLEGVSTPAYTKSDIEEMNNRTVEYNGKVIPQYEAEQKQRAMERQIRKERAKLAGYDEAIKAADSTLKPVLRQDFDNLAYKMKSHEAKYKDFSRQTGLRTQTERLQMRGFNKSVSQKAVAASKRVEKSIENNSKSGIIGLNRKTHNTGPMSVLPERMSKKHIRSIAQEYKISLKGIQLNIDRNEELLHIDYSGRADYENVGSITFFPNAFKSKEELLRTLFHEKIHVEQYRIHGTIYVQNHMRLFEDEAYQKEELFIKNLKERGLL